MNIKAIALLLSGTVLACHAISSAAGAPPDLTVSMQLEKAKEPAPSAPIDAARRSAAPSSQTLDLYVGQAKVLGASDVKRIVIGSGKVIQATVLDNGQVLVIPEAPGQSTLHLWDKNGVQQAYVVNVLAADTARLLSEVKAMLGAAGNLNARVVGDKIVVEGSNLTEEQASRLAEVAKRYPQVMNLVSRIGFERMIALDVRMLEIRRERMEQIGVRWNSSMAGPAFSVVGDIHRSSALRPGGAADSIAGVEARNLVRPFASALGIASSITSMIDLLVQNGDAVVLAEPSLSCRSGGTAKFLAGGEMPIPYSSGFGATSVQFKEYGIRFDVAPLASESGVIAAKIATEISAINFELVVKDVPGITKRRAETDVNLREHETLVIAGLLSDDSSRSIDRVPALGDLPVLGALFRSRAFRDRQSELVVFITPRFVDPMKPGSAWRSDRSSRVVSQPRSSADPVREPTPSVALDTLAPWERVGAGEWPQSVPADTGGANIGGEVPEREKTPADSMSVQERYQPQGIRERMDQARQRIQMLD